MVMTTDILKKLVNRQEGGVFSFSSAIKCLNIIRRSFLRRKSKGAFDQSRHTIMHCSSLTTAACVLGSVC